MKLDKSPISVIIQFTLLFLLLILLNNKTYGNNLLYEADSLYIKHDYFEALKRILNIIPMVAQCEWDDSYIRSVLAAIAVSKGFPVLAESILELSKDVSKEFMDWIENR